MRSTLSKCETMALHQGKRIHYLNSKLYSLLSYDCKTTYFTGSVDEMYAYLKEK